MIGQPSTERRILGLLRLGLPMSTTAIAKALSICQTTIYSATTRLERERCIRRVPAPSRKGPGTRGYLWRRCDV
jgi:predicted ArsR family transcriptional regulator